MAEDSTDSTTDGATPDQLVRLLALAKDSLAKSDDKDDDTQVTDSLANLLGTPMPVPDALAQTLPDIIHQMVKELPPLTGNSLESLLVDPTTDLTVIKRIKTYAKSKAKTTESSTNGEAATVLYYVALAHALVYHDKRITALSFETLIQSFEELILNEWLDKRFVELFKQGIVACSRKIETD